MVGIGRRLRTFLRTQRTARAPVPARCHQAPCEPLTRSHREMIGANMTTDQNKSAVRRLVEEGFNKHNLKLLDEIFSKDAISHDPSQPNLGRGPEGARESMQVYTTAFPDSRIVIEREIAEGDYVVQHLRDVVALGDLALDDDPGVRERCRVDLHGLPRALRTATEVRL